MEFKSYLLLFSAQPRARESVAYNEQDTPRVTDRRKHSVGTRTPINTMIILLEHSDVASTRIRLVIPLGTRAAHYTSTEFELTSVRRGYGTY